jgi:hypothetical protein
MKVVMFQDACSQIVEFNPDEFNLDGIKDIVYDSRTPQEDDHIGYITPSIIQACIAEGSNFIFIKCHEEF